jgi:ferredoxin
MKIVADRKKCAGHARCAAVSELFELDPNGYIGFDERTVPEGSEGEARRGVRACPERALRIVEDPPEKTI